MKKLTILSILCAFAAVAQAQTFITNGLVAYYPFNGNANDVSGNGNNGTPLNVTQTKNRFGKNGGAYYFNATNSSYVDISTLLTKIAGLSNATISVWLKSDANQTPGGTLFGDWGTDYPTSCGVFIQLNPSGLTSSITTVALDTRSNASGNAGISTGSVIDTNWHNLIVTFNGSNVLQGNQITTYIDGILVQTTGSETAQYIGLGDSIFIGRRGMLGGYGNYFNGAVSDVRIYSRTLSTNEVFQLYSFESFKTTAYWNACGFVAPSGWADVGISGDGTKIIATQGANDFYYSTNYGQAWIDTGYSAYGRKVGISSNGQYMLVPSHFGNINVSTTGGTSWQLKNGVQPWQCAAVSSDGSTMAVGTYYNGNMWISRNSGSTWSSYGGSGYWVSVSASQDGKYMVAGMTSGQIQVSTNYGSTWTFTGPSGGCAATAITTIGTKMIAGIYASNVFISTNSGLTWQATALQTTNNWTSLSCSSDGQILLAAESPGYLYRSINGGLSWTSEGIYTNWQSVSISSDGTKAVAAVSGGDVYTWFPTVAPIIASQPHGLTNNLSDTISLTVSITNAEFLAYQWYKDGIKVKNATNSILNINSLQPCQIGSYIVVATNNFGCVTSSVANVSINGVASAIWKGMIAYYPFNGNANDATGNGNDGNAYLCTFVPNGSGGTNLAAHFSAYSYMTTPVFSGTKPTNGSISIWIRNGGVQTPSYIESIWNASVAGNDFAFNLINSTPAVWGQQNYNGAQPNTLGCSSINNNTFSHVVVTWTLGGTSIYVNGVLSGSSSYQFISSSQSSLSFGNYFNMGDYSQYFGGELDDVRIYNWALSSNDVAQLYATEAPQSPQINQDLTNSYAVYGQNATLTIGLANQGLFNYQWYFVPANGSGQASGYAQTISSFVYGAAVTNGGFGYGNVPSVSFVGGNGSGAAGYATVSNGIVTGITVTNAGTGYSAIPSLVIGAPNGLIFAQINSTLTITNAGPNSLGNYFVVVSNASGSVTSSIVNMTLLYPPTISVNPVGFNQNYHTSNSLTVYGAGTAPLTYQWFLNNTNIPGATNTSYSISSLTQTNTGAYVVEVSNPYGYVYSTPVNVNILPTLTAPFSGAIGLWGQSTTLGVGAVGSGTLNYQWYFNGVAIPGATGSNYVFNTIQFTNAGLYSVVVSSTYGSTTNSAYQVVVNPANVGLGICPMIYINGTIGYNYTIQSSTNLADTNSWITVTNITLSATNQIWPDIGTDTSKSGNPKKFYRVVAGQ